MISDLAEMWPLTYKMPEQEKKLEDHTSMVVFELEGALNII